VRVCRLFLFWNGTDPDFDADPYPNSRVG